MTKSEWPRALRIFATRTSVSQFPAPMLMNREAPFGFNDASRWLAKNSSGCEKPNAWHIGSKYLLDQ